MIDGGWIDHRAATVVLGLGTLVSHGFGLALVPALLPSIEDSFGSGFTALGVAVAAGLVAYAAGGLAASKVLDWLPNRTVLNATFLLTGVALFGASLARSPALIAIPVMGLGVAAPISWAATTHIAARTVEWRRRSLVMGGASGGVGLGVIVNGGLVSFFSGPESWRSAFVVAAVISLVVTTASIALFRNPVDRPSSSSGHMGAARSYRVVLGQWPGRVVVVTSAVAGVSSYTFTTFLTATAIENMGVGPTAAGALLWMMGGLGIVASLSLGRAGDSRAPILVVAGMFLACASGLGVVTASWSYPALVLAALGVAFLNYPVWGLVATIATNRFDAPAALRAVSMGLVGAAVLSATANVVAARWFDSVGSMRAPLAILALLAALVAVWLVRTHRQHVAEPGSGEDPMGVPGALPLR